MGFLPLLLFSCWAFGLFWPNPNYCRTLKAFPVEDISVEVEVDPISLEETTQLRFSSISWNSGAGPLELFAEPGLPAGQDVLQRVYRTDGSTVSYLAGTFAYHPSHNHFHLEAYADYTLAPVGAPPGIVKKNSIKTSFCILDTTKVNHKLPGAPKKPVYKTCSPIVQGMSVGWGDKYGAHLPGQSIDITANPDGLYELTLEFDPQNVLKETDDSDNASCVLLDIAASTLTVGKVGPCGADPGGPGEVSISSIDPTAGLPGTSINMTISGSGFTEGIAVGFENGSGPAPVVTTTQVLDATTITATVTIKNGGGKQPRTWDLRVGSAVLSDAFTVIP